MSKIVAVHVGEHKNPFSLLQQIDEAGFLDKVKRAVGLGKKEEPASTEEEPRRARPSATDKDVSALATLAGELMTPAPNEARLVVYLPHAWLKSFYLVQGGGAKLIDELDDTEIIEIATSAAVSNAKDAQARIVELKPGFSYDAMLTPPSSIGTADRAVLINAPKKLIAELRATGTDVDKAREVLKKLMSHKIYVMTLNLSKAGDAKMVAAMGTARNTDEMGRAFNPAAIENYPVNARLTQAKEEWAALSGQKPKRATKDEKREADIARKEKEAEWAERERAADARKSGPSTDENADIINRITKAESAFKAAESLQGWASAKGIAKADLLARLDSLQARYPLVNIPGVSERLQKLKF